MPYSFLLDSNDAIESQNQSSGSAPFVSEDSICQWPGCIEEFANIDRFADYNRRRSFDLPNVTHGSWRLAQRINELYESWKREWEHLIEILPVAYTMLERNEGHSADQMSWLLTAIETSSNNIAQLKATMLTEWQALNSKKKLSVAEGTVGEIIYFNQYLETSSTGGGIHNPTNSEQFGLHSDSDFSATLY